MTHSGRALLSIATVGIFLTALLFGGARLAEAQRHWPAPTTPTFSSVTASSMRVSWTIIPGGYATYKILRCSGVGCSNFVQIAAGVATLYYDDSGLSPSTSYSYRITGTYSTGYDGLTSETGTQSTSSAGPPTCSVTADQNPIPYGGSTVLRWSSANATGFFISNVGYVIPNVSDFAAVGPLATTAYNGTATSTLGSAPCNLTLVVTPPPAPTCSLTATPPTITSGQHSLLTWSSTNSSSGTISPTVGTIGTQSVGGSQSYSTPGTYIYTVPTGVATLNVEMWGAGGQAGESNGGGGGYTGATVAVTPGQTIAVLVGSNDGSIGGGGTGYIGWYGSQVGNGGGYSGIFNNSVSAANALVLAGGGGAGGYGGGSAGGGAGGGLVGQTGHGQGGTQTAGGAGGYCGIGTQLRGADACYGGLPYYPSGGGGGGWWGGGGGNSGQVWGGGGGGGSGYCSAPSVSGCTTTTGNYTIPANNGDPDKPAGAAVGNSGNGFVKISYPAGYAVYPTQTTTYTATMTGPTGLTGECQATVSLPPTCTLTLNPTSITPPQSSTLTWASQGGATSCTGTNFSTGGATAGNVSVAPSSPTTYTASCSNAAGSSQCTGSGSGGIGAALSVSCPISYSCTGAGNQTITRTNADCSTTNMTTCVLPQFCADTVDTCQIAPVSGSLTASPRIVASQSTSNLTWSTTNAVSCSVTGNSNTWTGLSSAASSCSPKSGSACVSNAITQFTTYTLVCDDADVDTTQDDFTATVNIYSVPTWTEL